MTRPPSCQQQLGDALPGAVSEAREARVNALHRLVSQLHHASLAMPSSYMMLHVLLI